MARPAILFALLFLALFAPGLAAGEEAPPLLCDGFTPGEKAPVPLAADPLAAQARSVKRIFIADFGLGTCFSCKQQKKVLDNIDSDYSGKVFIRFVHVSKEAPIADFHLIEEIPYLIFYDAKGEIALRHKGGMDYVEVADQLEKMGVKP